LKHLRSPPKPVKLLKNTFYSSPEKAGVGGSTPSLATIIPKNLSLIRARRPSPFSASRDRVYTVISGVFYIGLGDQFDVNKLQAYPPGAVVVLPGGTAHFHWAKSGEYITQVTAIGPLGLEYLDPKDDPRNG
jgi:hypothetical protein